MIEKFKFIFSEAFKSFKRYTLQSVISSLTITTCLLFLTFIIYLSNVSNNLSQNFKSQELVIDVYLNSKQNEYESKIICKNIDSLIASKKYTFHSKKDVLSKINLKNDLVDLINEDMSFLPCLCSFNVNESSIKDIDDKIKNIKTKFNSSISKIVYPKSYLIKFEKFVSTIYSFIFIIGIVILVISIFNISNVIKLNLNARKDIVETMILHGANNFIVKGPFIIEGILQGLIGSIISSILIIIIFNSNIVFENNHFIINSFISTISLKTYITLNLFLGILLGYLGSNLGIKKK
tara:strand:+ start:6611 stop:7489 length:879 start_codon:yes stop_codon:yes gene_type:complete